MGRLGKYNTWVFIFLLFHEVFSTQICTKFLREKQQEIRGNFPPLGGKGFPVDFGWQTFNGQTDNVSFMMTRVRMRMWCHYDLWWRMRRLGCNGRQTDRIDRYVIRVIRKTCECLTFASDNNQTVQTINPKDVTQTVNVRRSQTTAWLRTLGVREGRKVVRSLEFYPNTLDLLLKYGQMAARLSKNK